MVVWISLLGQQIEISRLLIELVQYFSSIIAIFSILDKNYRIIIVRPKQKQPLFFLT